mmetsp:Transcript_10016/g.28757  ORF Transcript_10016/g.28757 Transcript_10016/m.28757 type:complete len:109 (-) Transcript_10016:343-669(-)
MGRGCLGTAVLAVQRKMRHALCLLEEGKEDGGDGGREPENWDMRGDSGGDKERGRAIALQGHSHPPSHMHKQGGSYKEGGGGGGERVLGVPPLQPVRLGAGGRDSPDS